MKLSAFVIAFGLACALPLLAADTGFQNSNIVPALSPRIQIEGRYAPTPAKSVRLGFPGVTLHLHCGGGGVDMLVKANSDEVYFDVQVDDAEPVRLRCRAGEGAYPLLLAMAPGDHAIDITRRSESWEGVCEVIGFRLGDGAILGTPPPLPERKMLFIGDSITCGERTDIRPNDPLEGKANPQALQSDARLSFGKLLARRFHAQCHLVSYGGRGVIRDWQGMRTSRNAPQFYELALPDDPAALWNHDEYVPDAIVICLGTNDFNQGVPDENEFVNAYVEFVRKIRRDAPRAKIFLAESPILNDSPGKLPKRSVLRGYLHEVIERFNTADVQFAPVSHYDGVPGNGHPSRADHEAIANELEPVIRQALNW